MTSLAINIRGFRKRQKITQDQLANKLEVSGAAVSQWESAKKPITPELHNVIKMAKIFGTTVEHLVESKDIDIGPQAEFELNSRLLTRVFAALSQNDVMAIDFAESSLTRKAHQFNTLYVLYAGRAIDNSLSDIELMQYVGLADIDPKDKE
jgi:transcriptional regulator with XRE-family HTH domain